MVFRSCVRNGAGGLSLGLGEAVGGNDLTAPICDLAPARHKRFTGLLAGADEDAIGQGNVGAGEMPGACAKDGTRRRIFSSQREPLKRRWGSQAPAIIRAEPSAP